MKTVKTTLGAAAALFILPALPFAQGKAVYGEDDRLDYFAVTRELKELSDSVVSLWKYDNLTEEAGGFALKTGNLGEYWELCPGEKFREQPNGADCSGALVGEDLVMTAQHCVTTEENCKDIRFVFGYAVKKAGAPAATSIPAGEVYGCAKLVTSPDPDSPRHDYALVQLDRKVDGHKPLRINRGSRPKVGDGVLAIGHPKGLPLKVAGGANVRRLYEGFFFADLDTFGGSSGSPVFNVRNGLVEGLVTTGDYDFMRTPAGCYASVPNKQTGGKGEGVAYISHLSPYIPKLAGENTKSGAASSGAVNMDTRALRSLDILSPEGGRLKLNAEWNKRN